MGHATFLKRLAEFKWEPCAGTRFKFRRTRPGKKTLFHTVKVPAETLMRAENKAHRRSLERDYILRQLSYHSGQPSGSVVL